MHTLGFDRPKALLLGVFSRSATIIRPSVSCLFVFVFMVKAKTLCLVLNWNIFNTVGIASI